ncbi:hypothetical protein HanIR_Chr13g0618281 [Helianthus annuus]|nr:hypothetical protein HanIR_Chr13g0618281 [Helianthus annuus]
MMDNHSCDLALAGDCCYPSHSRSTVDFEYFGFDLIPKPIDSHLWTVVVEVWSLLSKTP